MIPAPIAALRPDDDGKLVREIVTPEGIPLRFTLARAGDRAGAFVLDMLVQTIVVVVISLGLSYAVAGQGSWLTAVVVLITFLLVSFYFVAFEVRWQGATPGKRWVGIRVIDARGGQLETSAVLARNLIRELEVWTPLRFLLASDIVWPGAPGWARLLAGAWAFVFLFMPVFNKDRLRVGDMIAGTRVVMQPRVVLVPDLAGDTAAAPNPGAAGGKPAAAHTFSEPQLGIYGIYELQVLEGVLRTRPGQPSHEEALRTVAEKVRRKIGYDAHVTGDEQFLREFYAAQRAYLEQRLLFGQRREDKFSR
jgi:uncharacterized RDD family membrane protein YckC